MNTDSSTEKSPLDFAKWLIAIAFFSAAIVGNVMYAEQVDTFYRVLAVVGLMLVAVLVAATTVKGQSFLQLLKEANIERRKVVCPTKQETTQTTMIVVAVVILVGLGLWGLDTLLGWVVKLLVG